MDIKETIERDLSCVGSLEALTTIIEETAEGHPYTITFVVEDDYDGPKPVVKITRTRPETPDEEMRRQRKERSMEEQRKRDTLQAQRRAEVERILNSLTLEELRKCQPLTKEETA